MNTDDNSQYKYFPFHTKLIIVIIIAILIIISFLLLKDIFINVNLKKEKEMVTAAKKYVSDNNITTSREIYLDIDTIKVKVPDECSFTSGVIFDGSSFIPNLVCENYQSNVIKSNKEIKDYIKLDGKEITFLAKGIDYYELGYISNENVSIVGNVGSEEGIYNIYYRTENSNKLAIRKVIVLDNPKMKTMFPSIKLNGDEVTYIVLGNNYQEKGIYSADSIDGDISDKVQITGNVNINVPGEYSLVYTVTNSKGYSNSTTRKIIVLNEESDLIISHTITPEHNTNGNVTIKLYMSDEFEKIIYPNKTNGKELIYEVTDNGIYKFIIYDKYHREIIKEIEITNIDKVLPTGTCEATIYDNKTEIKVTNNDKPISYYEYLLNESTIKTTTSNYTSSIAKPNTISVNIYDNVGNINNIKCSIIDKLTPKTYVDSNGKKCLEGYTCYVQNQWGDNKYPYCSTSEYCGTISERGCSLVSLSTAVSKFNLKSRSGTLHTPYTIYKEAYPVNNKGYCNGGCSSWTSIIKGITNLGLSTPGNELKLNKNTIETFKSYLRRGYPVVMHVKKGAYTSGSGHYVAVLAIRNDDYVYLYNTNYGTNTNTLISGYKQNDWIPISDLISDNGNADEYLPIGPAGMYK